MSNTLINKFSTQILALAYVLLSTVLQSCEDPGELPQVSTIPVDMIARTSAVVGGTILDEGSDSITDKGFCWSLEVEPDLSDHTSENIWPDDDIEWMMRGLLPNTTYFVRAYATNSLGTVYGNEESFNTKPADAITLFNPDLSYDSIQDIEGNIYKTIVIGEQEWMAENLKTTKFSDGEAIPFIAMFSENDLPLSPGYSWYENNEVVFKDIYGAYYNWYAINTGKVCPSGWHIPSDEEWKVLELYLGMSREEADAMGYRGSMEGAKLKESGTYNWVVGSEPGSNQSGFTALPGGSALRSEGNVGLWWTATPFGMDPVYSWIFCRLLYWDGSYIVRSEIFKGSFISVRCVKD